MSESISEMMAAETAQRDAASRSSSSGTPAERASVAQSSDVAERLRAMSADAKDWNGTVLKAWDRIRQTVESHKGGDLPRLMFESLIEDFTELLDAASDVIEDQRAMLSVAQASAIPLEATPEMVIAGELAGMNYMAAVKGDALVRDTRPTVTAEIYRAMVNCALAMSSTHIDSAED